VVSLRQVVPSRSRSPESFANCLRRFDELHRAASAEYRLWYIFSCNSARRTFAVNVAPEMSIGLLDGGRSTSQSAKGKYFGFSLVKEVVVSRMYNDQKTLLRSSCCQASSPGVPSLCW